MPFTLVAYNEDRASAITTLSEVSAVDDDHVRVSGSDIYVPELNRLIGYMFLHGTGTGKGNFTGGRIKSPSLRRVWELDVATGTDGIDGIHTHTENLASTYSQNATTAEAVAVGIGLEMFQESPLPLESDEALSVEMTNGAVTGARALVGIWLANGRIEPVRGEIRTIKATTSFTPTANQWSSGALTFATDLPTGRYQLVGAKVISDNTVGLFRFILTGYSWRPGGIIQNMLVMPDIYPFRRGKLGVWGEFTHLTPPRIEICELASVANPDVYLDLIKIA